MYVCMYVLCMYVCIYVCFDVCMYLCSTFSDIKFLFGASKISDVWSSTVSKLGECLKMLFSWPMGDTYAHATSIFGGREFLHNMLKQD